MTVKMEAAYHEAGHAVMAHRSRFHAIVGPVDLGQYGAGELFVSLSKSKLAAANKPVKAEAQRDKDVAKDLAGILAAGLVAEQIAASKDETLKPNPGCAQPDHVLIRQQLSQAGLSRHFNFFEDHARSVLTENWSVVEALAAFLYKNVSVAPETIVEFIDAQ